MLLATADGGAQAEGWEAALEGLLELWEPDRGLSDLAAALKNGSCAAIHSLSPEVWQACWAHIWRAVMNNRAKLKDSSADAMSKLFTDLCFLHEVPLAPLLDRLVRYGLNPTRLEPNRGTYPNPNRPNLLTPQPTNGPNLVTTPT